MAEIKTPVFNNTGAATSPNLATGDIGRAISSAVEDGSGIAGATQNALDNFASTDQLRQFVIFELVNVRAAEATVPQSNPTFPFMVMHMNPEGFEESYQKLITRQVTRGGHLEQHWGEELDTITCTASTGAFVSIRAGLSALNRKASIAYRKYLELVALYRNNGNVHDQRGNIIFHGGVNLHFDSNIYHGYFENLNVVENAENPYTFTLDFVFKVEHSFRTMGL